MRIDYTETYQRYGNWGKWPIAIVISLAAVVFVRNAWIGDDAYITLRTVDNFINGYGLTWNISERVQAFTHPLWMFLLSAVYWFTREAYYTTIFVSLVLSVLSLVVFAYGVARTFWTALFGVALLVVTKSFVDYTSSGLENPLSFFLAALFYFTLFRKERSSKNLCILTLLMSAAALNRMDSVLLFLPAIGFEFLKQPGKQALKAVLFGLTPIVGWIAFSLFYFGFPFPNTAYAKLNTGIDPADLIRQGKEYYLNCARRSPLTLVLCSFALVAGLARRLSRETALAVGILLYLLYILKIGGGFMTGRFFALPLFCSVMLLSQIKLERIKHFLPLTATALLALGLLWPRSPVLSGADFGTGIESKDWDRGIMDERAGSYQLAGLLVAWEQDSLPIHPWAIDGFAASKGTERVIARSGIGFFGFYAGPQIYIVDGHCLTDPLRSRLPITNLQRWRIGHFRRPVPEGYLETLRSGKNLIADDDLARYYDKLSLAIKGDLLSWSRIVEIVKLNLGSYDNYLRAYASRPDEIISYNRISQPKKRGTNWLCKGCRRIFSYGLGIRLDSVVFAKRLEISADHNDDYSVTYMRDGEEIGKSRFSSNPIPGGGLQVYSIDVPDNVVIAGYDQLDIRPVDGDGNYSIGHVILLTDSEPRDGTIRVTLAEVSLPRAQGTRWNDTGCYVLDSLGILITLDSAQNDSRMEISLDNNDTYIVSFILEDESVGQLSIGAHRIPNGGLRVDTVDVPGLAIERGFDKILVKPELAEGLFSFGHIRLLEGRPQD